MLGQRIVTAVVLLALLLPAMWTTRAEPFTLLTLAFVAAAAWEWGRLNQAPGTLPLVMAGLLALACMVALLLGWAVQSPPAAWWTATAVWAIGGSIALRGGPVAWPHLPRPARWIIGLIGCYCGLRITGGAEGVGRATTASVVASIFAIIVADSIFTTLSTVLG